MLAESVSKGALARRACVAKSSRAVGGARRRTTRVRGGSRRVAVTTASASFKPSGNNNSKNNNSSLKKNLKKPGDSGVVSKAIVETDVEYSSDVEEGETLKSNRQMLEELVTPPAGFSGLQGKALVLEKEDYPTMKEINDVIPDHCKKLDTTKSMLYFAMSTGICLVMGLLANAFIPMKMAFLPAWIAYGLANGTCMFGFWLMGHECGHFAFSNNLLLQDAVGFFSHTLCLTPYFSWQRSHAVHHSKVNHIYEGESHVPKKTGEGYSAFMRVLKEKAGTLVHGIWSSAVVMIGFALYLLFGASGGPAYGLTNHFWPKGIFKTKLFPKKWHAKVISSGLAVIGVVGALAYWAKCTSFWTVAAVYGGPYVILNAWLGVVTLLHHTDTDVPHLEGEEWSFIRGAFLTIDRPYYPIVDWVQHHIGSTHVLHHINPRIAHYHAQEATDAIAKKWPHLYLYDPTPVHTALWRVVTNCISVKKINNKLWVYDSPFLGKEGPAQA
jgi:omega-6 fatty acid desaturase (delta-12 desaturase)